MSMPSSRKKLLIVLAVVAILVVVAGAVGLSFLDSFLLKQARAQADAYSQKLGRRIVVGDVSTKVLSGLAVRVSGVEIGPGRGETEPLLVLPRLEVRAALLKLVASGGKHVEIQSVRIDGLTINLVRFPDGTTNLERVQTKVSQTSGSQAEQGQQPSDLSALQVGHFSLNEGSIHLITQEKGTGRSPELNIQHLHIDLHDLRAGKPLDVLVQAAVLGNQQNFELHLVSAPLPSTLIPTPKEIKLKIQPTDLRPIAPYIPKSVGLQEGRFAADLTADLGAAVPGGKGETKIHGTLNALGLLFAGAEGSKPFDVVLDAALQADAHKGDVQIDRLKLGLGPAEITGKGRALGLTTDKPRVEGLEVTTHNFDPAQIAAVFPPLRKQLKGQVAGPIGLVLRGSGSQASQTIELKVDLTPVRLAIPEMLAKAAGAPMTATAHLGGAPAGAARFDFEADLTGVDLRPGRSLNKAPGQPLDLALSGTKSGDLAGPLKVNLEKITAHLQDAVFTGNASAELNHSGKSKRTDFEASIHSPHLDLDKLLLPSQSKQKSTPLDPATFAGLHGHVVAKIDDLRKSNVDFKNLVADAKLVEDEVTLQVLSFDAFGGKVSANGTTIRLAGPKTPFRLTARAQNIEVAQALTLATDRKVFSGAFGGDFNFSGTGTDKEDLIHSLSGSLQGHLLDGKLLSKDLIGSVSGPLAKALPRGLASGKSDDGTTSLGKDLALSVSVDKGYAKLNAPIKINLPEGQISLGGGFRLDGTLDLAGVVTLAPATVSALTNGKVSPREPIPVNLKIGGAAWKPVITDMDLSGAVASIAKQAATSALGRFFGSSTGGSGQPQDKAQQPSPDPAKNIEEEAKKRLKGLFGH